MRPVVRRPPSGVLLSHHFEYTISAARGGAARPLLGQRAQPDLPGGRPAGAAGGAALRGGVRHRRQQTAGGDGPRPADRPPDAPRIPGGQADVGRAPFPARPPLPVQPRHLRTGAQLHRHRRASSAHRRRVEATPLILEQPPIDDPAHARFRRRQAPVGCDRARQNRRPIPCSNSIQTIKLALWARRCKTKERR